MLYRFRCTETYQTEIVVKANTELEAIERLDAAQDDVREARLIDHWLSKGYSGRVFDVVDRKDEKDADLPDDWDFASV